MSHPPLPEMTNQELIVAVHTPSPLQPGQNTLKSRLEGLDLNCKKECRVCLEESDESSNELMSICRCTGSLRYIHRLCLQSWLLKKYEESESKDQFKGNELFCQICHSPYSMHFSIDLSWGDCGTFTGKIRANKGVAVANILFVVADIMCLIFSSSYAIHDYQQYDYNIKQPKYFLVYVAILLSLISTIYGIYEFIRVFAMEEKIVVSGSEAERHHPYIRQVQSCGIRDKEQGKGNETTI